MKKLLIITAMFIFCLTTTQAQGYRLNAAGKIETVKKDSTKVKKADTVYQIVNGTTFYKGSKGGIYYLKTAKTSGKQYKVYVK